MICTVCLLFAQACTRGGESASPRPNIILIMADDMGYSDLACFGGEIFTPNLDRLAEKGLRFTQFYNGARCCPTRASLLTGLAPHQAGMGWMTIRDLGHEGYTGELNTNCVTLAEVLRDAGYATFMSGKWHLTPDSQAGGEGDRSSWPLQRGFDRFFGTILGAGSFYTPGSLTLDNQQIEAPPGFFYTDAIAANSITFLEDHMLGDDQPFFLYMAYTAPHWPLHARDSTTAKYLERYDAGWDQLREERYLRMQEMGLVHASWLLTERDSIAPAWEMLDEEAQADMVKRMAVYAAQVDEMDQSIGRLISFLEAKGQLDNTLVLFLADNGGCAEFVSSGQDRTTASIGQAESFESYRLPWANFSNTPFREYKHWTHEGGIATPLIAHWPAGISNPGTLVTDPAQINDIMPTVVDLSEGAYPVEYRGRDIHPIEGRSIRPLFQGEAMEERALYWEHEANRAIRKGRWKLVSKASFDHPFIQDWELYDLEADRTETHDLAGIHPEVVRELSSSWEKWAEDHQVHPLDGRDWWERLKTPVIFDATGSFIGGAIEEDPEK